MSTPIITRFAPSPTGFLHIGGVRTALFAWLWARKNNGRFLLRIEDTDQARSTQAATDAIIEAMAWLGLDYDQSIIFQSHNQNRHKQIIEQLLKQGDAYRCYCTKKRLDDLREKQKKQGIKAKYDGFCRQITPSEKTNTDFVIRFKNPLSDAVVFSDKIKGEIRFANTELDDFVIARENGSPTYNLSVVVDDHDAGISDVIRGDDHVNNTPKQINLYQALKWPVPSFAHVPMILGSDGARLSKRHSATDVLAYRQMGYLPHALLNYLVRLGWSYGDQEIFSLDELIQYFQLNAVNKSAATFNPDKLLWLNQHYIQNQSDESLAKLMPDYPSEINSQNNNQHLEKLMAILKTRAKTLADLKAQCQMFYQDISFDEQIASKQLNQTTKAILQSLKDAFCQIDLWQADIIKTKIDTVCQNHSVGFGKVGQPLRMALSGNGQSPSIDITTELLGKKNTLKRLDQAIAFIENKQTN